ncbi:hypothetical protein HUT11_33670 [Streptomyces seoulensis]|nr:hypothetical protein HUT11_33670 [Streptomyces seoulensis]
MVPIAGGLGAGLGDLLVDEGQQFRRQALLLAATGRDLGNPALEDHGLRDDLPHARIAGLEEDRCGLQHLREGIEDVVGGSRHRARPQLAHQILREDLRAGPVPPLGDLGVRQAARQLPQQVGDLPVQRVRQHRPALRGALWARRLVGLGPIVPKDLS